MLLHFGPSLFLFFLQLINNWPKLPVFIFDYSDRGGLYDVKINWERPKLKGLLPYLNDFANTVDDFKQNYGLTRLSICEYIPTKLRSSTIIYDWKIISDDSEHIEKISNYTSVSTCQLLWSAPFQSQYAVTVNARLNSTGTIVINGRAVIDIKDYWIVSIGDSFASGEGNPDIPAITSSRIPAQWISNPCHRSCRSWAFKVYEKIAGVMENAGIHFTYLPCTGASVDNGILFSSKGQSQLDIVKQISKLRNYGPDLLLMSAGGNDIGYSDILSSLIWGESTALFRSINMRFFYASHQFDRLAVMLKTIKPSQVVIPHYFDLTRNDHGIIDADCTGMRQISTKDLKLAERKILRRINKLISKKAERYRWTVIDDVTDLFHYRGFCSSRSLIRSVGDSMRLQGNSFGAFHPTEEAHRSIANLIWKKIEMFKQR